MAVRSARFGRRLSGSEQSVKLLAFVVNGNRRRIAAAVVVVVAVVVVIVAVQLRITLEGRGALSTELVTTLQEVLVFVEVLGAEVADLVLPAVQGTRQLQ